MIEKCEKIINDGNNSNIVNLEELKIILEWTEKAYFNKESYRISYFNEEKKGWLKVPFIYPEILFEKFIKSINKEDYKELLEIVFSTSGYYELEAKYDLYDQLLRENGLLDYYYKFREGLNEKLLIRWCNENSINYEIKRISNKSRIKIINKLNDKIDYLSNIEFAKLEEKIYKNFCNELSKERKYRKIVSKVKKYDSFENMIGEYDEIDDEWTRYVMNYRYTNLLKKKWGKDFKK